MAVQDNFIGNLRGTNANGMKEDVKKPAEKKYGLFDSFIKNLRNSNIRTGGEVPKNLVDKDNALKDGRTNAPMSLNGTRFHTLDDKQGAVWDNSWFEPIEMNAMPSSEQEWKEFSDGLEDLDGVLNMFSNESNQDARIKIIEQNAHRFNKSPKLARMVNALYKNEMWSKKGEYPDYDYRAQPDLIRQAVNDTLAHRYKRA